MSTRLETEVMKMTDAKQQFSRVASDVFKTRRRVLVEKGGIPVVGIVTADDLERLNRLDKEWEADFAILDRIGEGFAGEDPDEIERQALAAVAEVRAERRATRS
jgi:hypothetical protein